MTTCFIGLLALLLVIAGYDSAQDMKTNGEETVAEEVANEAEFTEDAQPSRPDNWGEWIFVAMPVTLNTLNGRAAVLPEAQAVTLTQLAGSTGVRPAPSVTALCLPGASVIKWC